MHLTAVVAVLVACCVPLLHAPSESTEATADTAMVRLMGHPTADVSMTPNRHVGRGASSIRQDNADGRVPQLIAEVLLSGEPSCIDRMAKGRGSLASWTLTLRACEAASLRS